MAVLNQAGNVTRTSREERGVEAKPVDLSDASLKQGKKSKLDPTEDAWSRTAPPPKGEDYTLKIFLAKDGMKQGLIDKNDADSIFYEAELECKTVSENPDIDNFTVFGRVSTKIGRGKNISTMAGLINKMGYKLPEEATPLQLAKMLKAAIAKSPILYDCHLDWSGWSKNDNKVVCSSMDDFPQDEEGNPVHQFKISNKDGGKEEITASLKIRVWGNKRKGVTGSVGGSTGASKTAKQVVEDTGEGEEAPAPAPKVVKASATAKPKAKAKEPEPEVIEEELVEGAGEEEEGEIVLDEE